MLNKRYWVLLILLFSFSSYQSWAKDNAVILLYHHVSEQTPAATSVSPKVFEQHLKYLAQHHSVLPLQKVIEALENHQPLPDNAVVITFDDGYDNIFTQAHPLLHRFNFPYTVFINPPLIGSMSYQLDWQQVKTMATQGATFANHGNYHDHLLTKQSGENPKQWLKRVMTNIQDAERTLKEQVGYSLKYFAYPYGEFNSELKSALREQGYVGFAQISGAIASYSDFGALPRFPAAGIYSRLNSLTTKLDTLAMPIKDIYPSDPVLSLPVKPFKYTFSLDTNDLSIQQLNCFVADKVIDINRSATSVSIDFQPLAKAGRQRINCTAPSLQNRGRYYWFSQPWFVPTEDGTWLD